METNTYPETLVKCIRYFADPQVCHDFAVSMPWPEGVVCPFCQHDRVYTIKTRRMWQCKSCNKQFSVKVGTIFEDSPLSLDKWLVAIWLLTSAKNGVSSHEMARSLGITQKTAWFLEYRIRHILQTGSVEKMTGTVEVDETFVGGKAKNMHRERKERTITGRGTSGKTIVMGILQRGNSQKKADGKYRKPHERIYSQMHTKVIANTSEETLCNEIKSTVSEGTEVFMDAHKSYRALTEQGFKHAFVDHAVCYVEGRVHTNACENFWGLLDRQMHGPHVFCFPDHLFRYVDELTFRFNHRGGTD